MNDEMLNHAMHDHSETPGHTDPEFPSTGATPVPLAEPIPNPVGSSDPFPPIPTPIPLAPSPSPTPIPNPAFHICLIDLKAGCYRITFRPNAGVNIFHGTMRVDKTGGTTTISGDLYRFLNFPLPFPPAVPPVVSLATPPVLPATFPILLDIPIYAR